MNRRISICILVFVMLTAFVVLFERNPMESTEYTPQKDNEQLQESQATMDVSVEKTIAYAFFLRICDGRVVVYRPESTEIYMETGIVAADLPEDVQRRLEKGIGFYSEELLFDFLESYSS